MIMKEIPAPSGPTLLPEPYRALHTDPAAAVSSMIHSTVLGKRPRQTESKAIDPNGYEVAADEDSELDTSEGDGDSTLC